MIVAACRLPSGRVIRPNERTIVGPEMRQNYG
jgi:hypothetical protein